VVIHLEYIFLVRACLKKIKLCSLIFEFSKFNKCTFFLLLQYLHSTMHVCDYNYKQTYKKNSIKIVKMKQTLLSFGILTLVTLLLLKNRVSRDEINNLETHRPKCVSSQNKRNFTHSNRT